MARSPVTFSPKVTLEKSSLCVTIWADTGEPARQNCFCLTEIYAKRIILQHACSSAPPSSPVPTCNLLLLDFAFPLTSLATYTLQSQCIPPLTLVITHIACVPLEETRGSNIICRTTESTTTNGGAVFEVLGACNGVGFKIVLRGGK